MDSLLLSTNYYNPEVLNDNFLKRVYNYYYMKGHIPIIVEKCSYILINLFLIFFINVITNCIDYKGLYNFERNITITDTTNLFSSQNTRSILSYIDLTKLFPKNAYLVICLIIYFLYLVCMIINGINEIKLVLEMRNIYKETFNIMNNELEYISWNRVVEKVKLVYNDPNINIYTVSNRILRKENIIINLYKSKLKQLPSISKLLEWNFIFCFISPLFNNNSDIVINNKEEFRERVRNRCILVGVINLISIPFVLYIVVIYMLIKDGEQFYNNPELSFDKQLKVNGFWKLRYYNELNHLYDQRTFKIKSICGKINSFHSNHLKTKEIILRFINFVLSSIFIILILFSFVNDKILTDGIIIGNKTTLWVIGVLGALLAVNRKFITFSYNNRNNYHKEENELFIELKQILPIINPIFFEFKNRKKLIKIMNKMYCYKIYFMVVELIHICLAPYYLYKWYLNCDKYIDCIVDNLEDHFIMGKILNKSNMTNVRNLSSNSHCYYSYVNFIENNPEWKTNLMKYNDLTLNLKENSFLWSNSENEAINNSIFEFNYSFL
mgnify:FL=1